MKIRLRGTIAALAVFLGLMGFLTACSQQGSGPSESQTITLNETGSSLLYPLFNIWVPAYTQANPNVKITPQSTGSGTGIAQSVEGIVQIGASDAYISDTQMKQHPEMLNIPLAISMQMVNYNLPGLNGKNLKLSGPALAGIYQGNIRYWDDAAIRKINPGVHLPHKTIIPVHRTDGSGDTFIFSQYLSFSTPDWAKSLNYGTTISWPAVPGGLGAVGNPGMVTAIQDNPYSVAYIGTSFQDAIEKAGLGIAMLENRDGKFVLPTADTAKAAAAVVVPKTPKDERISLIFASGPDSYPIINYEYALVKSKQPSAEMAAALRKFFTWAISPAGGNSPQFMEQVHFVPLPDAVAKLSADQIAEIQ